MTAPTLLDPYEPPTLAARRTRQARRARRHIGFDAVSIAGCLQLLVALATFHLAVWLAPRPSATLVATAYLMLVPGAVALRALVLRPREVATELIYTVAASIAVLLVVILAVDVVGPRLSVARPLDTTPIVLALDATVVVLALIAMCRKALRPVPLPRRIAPAALLVVVPLSVAAGTQLLENRGKAVLVYAGLAAAGGVLLWALAQARAGREGRVFVALYCVALSLLWSYSLRSKGLYGFDVQQEFASFRTTAAALRWTPHAHDPYTAMLSITALPTVLARVTGLDPLAVYKVLFPAIFALYPLAVFAIARHWLRPAVAFLGTTALFLTGSVASQLPALARQEIALLLFAAILLAAFDRSLSRRSAQSLVLLLGAAMVVSHYSTTYVALGMFVGARLVALVLRGVHRGARKAVITVPVVVLLAAACAAWTGPVTHSANNVTSFASDLRTNGVQVLPNNNGTSPVLRWLAGNVTETGTPRAYFDSVGPAYEQKYPWLREFVFTPAVQSHFPAVESAPPTVRPRSPAVGAVLRLALTELRQAFTLGIVIGCAGVLLLLRRRRIDAEVAALVLSALVVTVFVRLSGSASFAYNPERLAMQTSALLVVPFGVAVQRLHRTLGRTRLIPALAALALVGLVFLEASGLAVAVSGGNPTGNLSTSGEYAERFSESDEDLAAAAWMVSSRRDDSIVFADRYGALTLQYSEGRDHHGVFPDLTPGTLDTRAFVFASTSNIRNGRARGTTPDNELSSTYQFPTAFLDTYKAVVFDTGAARVYS